MQCKYAVTFEFETRPPICIRGEMTAISPNTIASRAIKEARYKAKPRNWISMVVLLERLDHDTEEEMSESKLSEGDRDETNEQEVL